MKKNSLSIALFVAFTFISFISTAQNSIITTYAGTGVMGYSGDGGPATAAVAGDPVCMAFDVAGNFYFSSENNYTVRKIDRFGIISRFAGNGVYGYSGDGGPATAARFMSCNAITFDPAGNMYITDDVGYVIRKVNTAGIISTFAGTGVAGSTGDGGPATAAEINRAEGLVADAAGNVYFSDVNKIRKVNATGIISTFAGTGVMGFSGDGGPASAAQFSGPGLKLDGSGNFYIADLVNNRIRKINSSGIISTIAGNGIAGYSGDGGPAISASIYNPRSVEVDIFGNVYFSCYTNNYIRKIDYSGNITTVAGNSIAGYSGDGGSPLLAELNSPYGLLSDSSADLYIADWLNKRIRKISNSPYAATDSFSVFLNKVCSGLQINILTRSTSPLSLKTYFGDGATDLSTLATSLYGTKYLNLSHSYLNAGTYTLKQVLYNGSMAIDSLTYTYEYKLCKTIDLKFYDDINANCSKDPGEHFISLPFTIEVDSNGVAIDTISATSGLYYSVYGGIGDIYTFHIISAPAGLAVSCPSGGIFSDTLLAFDNSATRYIGTTCVATTFDLAEYLNLNAGRHMAEGGIIVNNAYCTLENPTVTLNISPQYVFVNSAPAPSLVSGGTITWNMTGVSAIAPQFIQFTLNIPGITWLSPGDTINTSASVTPIIGDMNPSNNNSNIVDTVKTSFDPNEMSVIPSGYILPGTQLQYTINFENTGNDTAFNIYIMDTLSDNVDVRSLRIVAASGIMNTGYTIGGGHNIVRFDFPGINLLDSSHHNLCNGMVIFTINTNSGLPNGTTIFNHAGIFFDDNPVVMTDTVVDIIGTPTLGISTQNNHVASIYPNPATDVLTIKMDNDAYNALTITNEIGQLMIQQILNSPLTKVDIKTLPSGLYYVTLRGENGTKVQKLVKM